MLEFKMTIGDEEKMVRISMPNGAGVDMYQVLADNYYHGRFWKTQHFGWRNDIKAPFTEDHVKEFIKMVEERKGALE